MWPFTRNKFKKLKREDVVESICALEKEEKALEESITLRAAEIENLLEKGKKENSKDLKLFYAKKIMHMREENANAVQREMYLLYNLKMLEKLKTAVEDKEFYQNTGKQSLASLLADQKGLANFLHDILQERTKNEQILTDAEDLWEEVETSVIKNERIYNANQNDDALLALFEEASALEEDIHLQTERQEHEKLQAQDVEDEEMTE